MARLSKINSVHAIGTPFTAAGSRVSKTNLDVDGAVGALLGRFGEHAGIALAAPQVSSVRHRSIDVARLLDGATSASFLATSGRASAGGHRIASIVKRPRPARRPHTKSRTNSSRASMTWARRRSAVSARTSRISSRSRPAPRSSVSVTSLGLRASASAGIRHGRSRSGPSRRARFACSCPRQPFDHLTTSGAAAYPGDDEHRVVAGNGTESLREGGRPVGAPRRGLGLPGRPHETICARVRPS